jgi:murein DD-endopeptidase MepM/ murein hydrolase activator NlpD
MWKKKITVWFSLDHSGIFKQLHIRKAWFYSIPAAVVVLLFVTLFSMSTLFGDRVNEDELAKLRAENLSLKEKYDKLRTTVSDVGNKFDELVQKELAIRSLFNLPEVNAEERQLGTGGPMSAGLFSMSAVGRTAAVTEAELDRLVKLSQFETDRYQEIEGALVGLKDKLAHTPSIWPTRGWSMRGFGMQNDPFTGYPEMHKGIDISNAIGTPIVSTAMGRIIYAGYDPGGLGNLVAIDHGFGYVTRYGHMSKVLVKNGTGVTRGQIIGLMGSTGYSTGSHVHYEVYRNGKVLNPREFMLNQQ